MLQRPIVIHLALTTCITTFSLGTGNVSAQENNVSKSVTTATAAIAGSEGSSSGEAYGVVGTSSSPDGAGIGAANLAGGADLVLDGNSDGQANALLSQGVLDRPSAGPQSFDFTNSIGGGMTLLIDGVNVVTTATDSDVLGGLSCMPDQMPLWNGSNWTCVNRPIPRDPGQHLALNGNAFDVVSGPDSGLDADTLDGLEGDYYARKLQRVVTVSAFGGDFATVQGALDSITDAAAENRYLVKVGPGVYIEQVTMKSYVDIEGSGQDVTTILWGEDGGPTNGTVFGADHAELRYLTVVSDGGRNAMVNDATAPSLTHVTLHSLGALFGNFALFNHNGGSPNLSHCTLEADGDFAIGAMNEGGRPRFENVVINSEGVAIGMKNFESDPELINVEIRVVGRGMMEAYGILNEYSEPLLRSCSISVAGKDAATAPAAYGVWTRSDSNLTILDTDITVGHADINVGLFVKGSDLKLSHSRLTVTGDQPEGIHAEASGSTLSKVEITSSSIDINVEDPGSLNCHGVFTNGARIRIAHSQFRTSNVAYCGQGVAVRIDNPADQVFLANTSINQGTYASVPGVTETCLAVSEWLIDPLFYSNTCP